MGLLREKGKDQAGPASPLGLRKRKRRGGPRGDGEGRASWTSLLGHVRGWEEGGPCDRTMRGAGLWPKTERGESGLQPGRPKSKEGASLFLFYISKAYFELDFEFFFSKKQNTHHKINM